MYRKRHRRIAPDKVANFLILDRFFPRAIAFCLFVAQESLRAITGTPANQYRNVAEQRLGQLTARLNYSDIEGIMKEGLHEFIDSLQLQLNRIDDAIHETFFALPKVSGSDSSPLKNLGQ